MAAASRRDRIDRWLADWVRWPDYAGEPYSSDGPTRRVAIYGGSWLLGTLAFVGIAGLGTGSINAVALIAGLAIFLFGAPWGSEAFRRLHDWWATRQYPRHGGSPNAD